MATNILNTNTERIFVWFSLFGKWTNDKLETEIHDSSGGGSIELA
jgi:hypothetical protein